MSKLMASQQQIKKTLRHFLANIPELVIFSALILLIEGLILTVLTFLGHQRSWGVVILEAGLMFISIVPAYYWLLIRPMKLKTANDIRIIERLQFIMDSAIDGQLVVSRDGIILFMNSAAKNMPWQSGNLHTGRYFGLPLLIGTHTEIELLHKGVIVAAEMYAVAIQWDIQEASLVTLRDISERKKTEEKMLYMAHYDSLTGLPNRQVFYDRLEQEIKRADRNTLKIALMFIDLDHFKEVNDTLGHAIGDQLLIEVSQRIHNCVRETDTLARLGGDEFTVILPDLVDVASIERIASNILQKLAEPFQLDSKLVEVSGSIGIALYPDHATDVEELVQRADHGMYTAKKMGRSRFFMFGTAEPQTIIKTQSPITGQHRERSEDS